MMLREDKRPVLVQSGTRMIRCDRTGVRKEHKVWVEQDRPDFGYAIDQEDQMRPCQVVDNGDWAWSY